MKNSFTHVLLVTTFGSFFSLASNEHQENILRTKKVFSSDGQYAGCYMTFYLISRHSIFQNDLNAQQCATLDPDHEKVTVPYCLFSWQSFLDSPYEIPTCIRKPNKK